MRITVSEHDWAQALHECRELIEDFERERKRQTPTRSADLLRSVMRTALAPCHRWLAEHDISAVISADEADERTFVFYFDNQNAAEIFRQAWTAAKAE